MRFKVGDKVRCTDPIGYEYALTDGAEYTVTRVNADGDLIAVDSPTPTDGPVFAWRFQLVDAAPRSTAVHRPAHYARFKIEPITFIAENNIPFMPGNVIKYVMRWDAKDGIQDLKKARRYLDMMIAKAEGREDWSA